MINPITDAPFTTADADRLLRLADQFLEDWELDSPRECSERRAEFGAIRPLLVAAPELLAALRDLLREVVHLEKEADYDFSAVRRLVDSLGEGA